MKCLGTLPSSPLLLRVRSRAEPQLAKINPICAMNSLMNYIQTGDIYNWWENKYGRPYPTEELERSDTQNDYLQNWCELLYEKTLDDVEVTCASHLKGLTTPLSWDNQHFRLVRQEIIEKVIKVF